ncbi:hypothetical protein HYT04_02190 [Candidatus Kaiserbacteria bacterium]|nr:hypothetical protein [Candidatus Kaiserbacteria bacterium]
MSEILIVVGLLAVIAILGYIIILLLANLGAYFTKIAQGTTVFIDAGDKLRSIWPNVGGYKMSQDEDLGGRHWLIPTKNKDPKESEKERMESFFHDSLPGTVWFQKWLWRRRGVRFMSWFWGINVTRHCFDLRKGGRRRIEARSELKEKDAPLRSRVVDSEGGTDVDSLLFIAPRPVYVEGVELAGDNSKINLLLLPVFQQVIPALPVYYLMGDFFTLLDAAVEAGMVDLGASHRVAVYKGTDRFAHNAFDPKMGDPHGNKGPEYENMYEPSPLTYSHWLKLTKAGEGSPLEQRLHLLNVNKAYRQKLVEKGATELVGYIDQLTHEKLAGGDDVGAEIPSGIIPRFGFALVSIRSVEWEPHGTTENLAKALLAREIQFHTAEGVRKEAEGVRDAILARAEGESSRYERLATALINKGVDPNVAAEVVRTQLRTENIGGPNSKVRTYVEGGASASVMVPADSDDSDTETKNKGA